MKKLIVTISIIAALGLNANAQYYTNSQTDGFFTSTTPSGQYRDGSANELIPGMPGTGIFGDQDAPIGSGLLLLAGLGLAYGLRKKNNN